MITFQNCKYLNFKNIKITSEEENLEIIKLQLYYSGEHENFEERIKNILF